MHIHKKWVWACPLCDYVLLFWVDVHDKDELQGKVYYVIMCIQVHLSLSNLIPHAVYTHHKNHHVIHVYSGRVQCITPVLCQVCTAQCYVVTCVY